MTSPAASSPDSDPHGALAPDIALLRQTMADSASPSDLSATCERLTLAFAAARRLARSLREHPAPTLSHLWHTEPCLCHQARAVLEQWLTYLPRLHGWLLAERQRLSSRRAHAAAVRDWLDLTRPSP